MTIRWAMLMVLFVARTAGAVTAQPLDPPTLKPEDLAQALVGAGISISNVTFFGMDSAAGTFVDGMGSVGIDGGIILSSGMVADITGPNKLDDTTTEFGGPGDADLDGINPGFLTHDASVLEFDFVPAGPEITFSYVFASEEYDEFVASEFNDVFAFFVNGVNLALLPDGTTPVSINNVNGGNPDAGAPPVNPTFFVRNDCSDGPCPIDFEADGRTVTLTLKAAVTPGVTNHLKLAIADAGDDQLDSWVFIKAGSLTLSENCTNGLDDDGDGLVDNADPDCQVCGDGNLDPGEACDDGNVAAGDGCSPTCTIEPPTTTLTTSTTTSSSSTETVPTTSSSSTSTSTELPTTSSSTSTSTTSSSSSSSSAAPTTSSTTTTLVTNRPPSCADAQALPASLSPPNHTFADVHVGVTDPDGDPVDVTVTGITQDEPLDGTGDGTTCPDATGVGTDTASVRAERAASGNGRVYHIAFAASDGKGGQCTGVARVCVPHDAKGSCVDEGPLFDSSGPAGCPSVDAPSVSPLGDDAVYPVSVTVPPSTPGKGKVKVKGELFVDPIVAALSSPGASAAVKTGPVKVSAPIVRTIKPGGNTTLTLRLNGRGKHLLRDTPSLTVRVRVTVKRKGLEATSFDFIAAWLRR